MKWFASDLHLGQHKILEYTPRGRFWTDIDAHDEAIIDALNMSVAVSDELFFVGDMAMAGNKWRCAELIDRIACRNIHLVIGNHDRNLSQFYADSGLFASVQPIMHITHNKQNILMYHWPIAHWHNAEHGTWHLHGHFHGDYKYVEHGLDRYKILDVGIDALAKARGLDGVPNEHTHLAARYHKPVSFDDLKVIMADRINMPDRHGKPD